jgi:hypothetical protein
MAERAPADRSGRAVVNSLRIVETLFAACPTDVGAWSGLLDASAHLRIGNRPPAVGRDAVLGELGAFLAGVAAIGHGYREVWALEEATLVETDVVPRTRDGPNGAPAAPLPCVMVFRTGAGALALDLRFYLDPTSVFGPRAGWLGAAHRPSCRAGML